MKVRKEKDSLGTMNVPSDALWGAQTQRAVLNFQINSGPLPESMIRALGLIKKHSAKVNKKLGLIEPKIADSVYKASDEVWKGKHNGHFPVDIFQTGSGTSSNMNANEVIANRAARIMGKKTGQKLVHPNDHVNKCQSSNDVFPSAIHIATAILISANLGPALVGLKRELSKKQKEFKDVIKIGRTHLQDALPMRLSQEFSGYAAQIENSIKDIEHAFENLKEIPLGGTAIGTGLNAHKDFAKEVIKGIVKETTIPFRQAKNTFESMGSKGALMKVSASLRNLAIELFKIANDIRWLGSGPFGGIAEIKLPSVQPGSSIMPGKVNPVIPEMMIQICAKVIGNDISTVFGGTGGIFELNVMMPLIAKNVIESVELLSNGITAFIQKCIRGLKADKKRSLELVEKSLMLVTNLTGKLGYDLSAEIAKEALNKGKTIRQIVTQRGLLTKAEADKLLDPFKMT